MKGKLHEYYILIQILNAKKSNNLIQDITWKAIYTGLPSSKMWELISCKLIGTVRQPSVGRNLWCCGFRKSRVDKYELLFRKSLKLSAGNLSGFFIACYFLYVWERLLGLFPSICDLINFNYRVKHALYYTQF